ncbi:MAG: 3-methyladenine DNA glycosylase [Candidatus Nitrosopolaris wilkensis]|nr:MAG: 3-methyladenine DNA glycosylase [Candidatus Nitrosopolaris wilkensis]
MICPDRSFYDRSTELVAKELLGNKVVRIISRGQEKSKRLCGIIIETEAYGFNEDAASHAFRGLTLRNAVMFGEPGRAYIYFIYGNHFCLNVSAKPLEIEAGAVLIRALQPVEGIRPMKIFRRNCEELSLTSGPGKLSQALNIQQSLNGEDMTDPKSDIHIEFGVKPPGIRATKRIGTSKGLDKKWRFVSLAMSEKGYTTNRFASRRW